MKNKLKIAALTVLLSIAINSKANAGWWEDLKNWFSTHPTPTLGGHPTTLQPN